MNWLEILVVSAIEHTVRAPTSNSFNKWPISVERVQETYTTGTAWDGFSSLFFFFRIFEIIIFCFVVAICYLVHGVKAMHGLC